MTIKKPTTAIDHIIGMDLDANSNKEDVEEQPIVTPAPTS